MSGAEVPVEFCSQYSTVFSKLYPLISWKRGLTYVNEPASAVVNTPTGEHRLSIRNRSSLSCSVRSAALFSIESAQVRARI